MADSFNDFYRSSHEVTFNFTLEELSSLCTAIDCLIIQNDIDIKKHKFKKYREQLERINQTAKNVQLQLHNKFKEVLKDESKS